MGDERQDKTIVAIAFFLLVLGIYLLLVYAKTNRRRIEEIEERLLYTGSIESIEIVNNSFSLNKRVTDLDFYSFRIGKARSRFNREFATKRTPFIDNKLK